MSHSRLALSVARDHRGRTRVDGLTQAFPLRTTAAMYLEPADPGMAHVYLQNPSGALFDGDDHEVDVRVGTGARLHLTTQSATRIGPSAGAGTRQRFAFDIADGGYAEHVPDALVPMAGASLAQHTRVDLLGGAAFLGVELLTPGRVAHGELFAYERVRLSTTVERDDGARCHDAVELRPLAGGPAVLGSHLHSITVLAAGPAERSGALLVALREVTGRRADVLAGASALPDELGVLVRVLSGRAPSARSAARELVDVARCVLADLPPARVRK